MTKSEFIMAYNIGHRDGKTGDYCPNDYEDMINTKPKQGKWISVEDRLPDKLKDVIVTFYDAPDEYDIAYMRKTFNKTYIANGAENEWVSSMGETDYADYEIAAWMPIQPYKADKETE